MNDALSRRRFLQSLASLGLVAQSGIPVLSGCSSAGETTPALDDLAS